MRSIFSTDFFINNRQALRRLVTETPLIIVSANAVIQKNNDNSYIFSQDRNFWYLTGLNEPDVILVIDNNQEYLILPTKSKYQAIFDGITEQTEIINRSGIKQVYDYSAGINLINQKIKQYGNYGFINQPMGYVSDYGFWINPGPSNLRREIELKNPKSDLVDIRQHLITLRQIKQPIEIKAIKNAINITQEALHNVKNKLSDYKFEYQIEADLNYFFKTKYNVNNAFEPIVAGGKRACILHNRDNDGLFKKNELVVIDIGAEFENYAADITRTYSLSKNYSSLQEKIFMSVKRVQDQAINYLKPGVLLKEYEQEVRNLLTEELLVLGLIKNSNKNDMKKIYPHATSHFLGLDVHDVGHYHQPLKSGMILTVEPGIYLPNKSIGVRIEDDILITDQGNESLSDLSRTLD